MPHDPFPAAPGDAEEPEGSSLPPAARGDGLWSGQDDPSRDDPSRDDPSRDDPSQNGWDEPEPTEEEAVQQGLYLSLPPEQLTLAGFAQGGEADTMAPGPLLATVLHVVTGEDGAGLSGLSDDQLMGIISAAQRIESRAAWTLLAATAEFAARRRDQGGPAAEFAAEELADELHLTGLSAAGQMAYARTVKARLPKTFAALAAGQIHPVHLRIIEDETQFLSEADAARADEILAQQAPGLTFGQLRYVAHKLVLRLDPESAQRRKDAARREAHVRRFREDSGNAGMVARELPSDEILASWQHIEQRALDLRAAGLPGPLQDLRVRAYLDLLQERDSRLRAADPPADDAASPSPASPSPTPPGPASSAGPDPDSGPPGSSPRDPGPPSPERSGPERPSPGPADSGPPRPGGVHGDPGPGVAALVNITVPLATAHGLAEIPGEVAGFGLLDGQDARLLLAAAARHPRTRWCVTALNPDGTAAAHGCATGRHPPPGLTGLFTGPDPPPKTRTIRMVPVARGSCDHAGAETGYRPSRALQHRVRARSARCTAPGCGRAAVSCDLDHTLAWDRGGRTCECNLAPLCRHHHRCKQAEGWHLDQPAPGVLVWSTPAGRTYTTAPAVY
jgi:hypothetical protein